jgi:hypothetical protein
MSLFSQLSGFQFPDVLMNSGPLPSTAGGPAGSDGSIDGVINGTSALLENISPYAMGKSARTGSDRNYQQIPHRFQYIIPKLYLPRFHSDSHIPVSHAVDQGDIAFLLYGGNRAWWTSKDQFSPRAPPCAFATIEVVNYILLCIQASRTKLWRDIRNEFFANPKFKAVFERLLPPLSADTNKNPIRHEPFDDFLVFKAVRMLVQEYFVPHGICAGSEHQGGQHETGTAPVQAAVNFVITMTVDGKNVDLVNYWYEKDMMAGDELVFTLERQEMLNPRFQLTRYYKDPVVETVDLVSKQFCWQLVPSILRATKDPPTHSNAWHHHRCQGYWRVAQTFQNRRKNNVHAFIRGLPLEVTFAPVWQSFLQCRDYGGDDHYFTSNVLCFDDTKALYSRARPDKMRWYYQDKQAFIIREKGDKYVTEIPDPQICVVYCDSNKKPEPTSGSTYTRQQLRDLHVIFGDDLGNVPSNWTPHKESKNPAKINKIEKDHFHESTVDLEVSQSVKKLPAPDTSFGAFNLTLTRRPCDRSGHTSGFASWYCQEATDIFLDFDCNFWLKTMGDFVVPTPKIEVTYDGIPKTSRTSAQSKDPTQPSSPVQQTNYSPPLQLHQPKISNVVLHMPAASVLESELEPKKRRKAAKILDSTQDAPGPSKAFKLCEDGPDAPGPLKAFKLCEDSPVAPGPTKRLKLVSTDDSGRASV